MDSDIKNICAEFVNAFQGNLSWKWEDRFEVALAEFNVANQDNIRGILERFLANRWDNSTISNAPHSIQQLLNKFIGLKTGQLLFTSDTEQDDFLFGLWWPWGNGNTISIRVAPSFIKLSEDDYQELIRQFREWFNI